MIKQWLPVIIIAFALIVTYQLLTPGSMLERRRISFAGKQLA